MELFLLGLCLSSVPAMINGDGPGVVKVVVKEDDDVILPCSLSTKENIVAAVFDWKKDGQKEVFLYDSGNTYNDGFRGQDEQFKERVSHFQDELKNGNASIKILNTKLADSGNYICIFPRFQPRQTFNIELFVDQTLRDRSGETRGASPKPYITVIDATTDGSRLHCEVPGAFPEPKVEWQDSDGNILPAEEPEVTERRGRYSVTLNVTVNKTDRYRCVVTQKEISHQVHSETFVLIREQSTISVDIGWFLSAVALNVILTAIVAIMWINRYRYKRAARGPVWKASQETNFLNSLLENKDSQQQTNGNKPLSVV